MRASLPRTRSYTARFCSRVGTRGGVARMRGPCACPCVTTRFPQPLSPRHFFEDTLPLMPTAPDAHQGHHYISTSPPPLSVSPAGDGGGWARPNVVMPLVGIRRCGPLRNVSGRESPNQDKHKAPSHPLHHPLSLQQPNDCPHPYEKETPTEASPCFMVSGVKGCTKTERTMPLLSIK